MLINQCQLNTLHVFLLFVLCCCGVNFVESFGANTLENNNNVQGSNSNNQAVNDDNTEFFLKFKIQKLTTLDGKKNYYNGPLSYELILSDLKRYFLCPLLIVNAISGFGKYNNAHFSLAGSNKLYIYTSDVSFLLGFGLNWRIRHQFYGTKLNAKWDINLHILGVNIFNAVLWVILSLYNTSYRGLDNANLDTIWNIRYFNSLFLRTYTHVLGCNCLQILECEIYICDYYSIRLNIGVICLLYKLIINRKNIPNKGGSHKTYILVRG